MRKQTKLAVMLASVALLTISAASVVSAKGWVQQSGRWYYVNSEGDYVTDTIQSSGNSKFYLGEDGSMQTDYFLEDYGDAGNVYYFGSNGAMVTNTWVAIDPSIVSNQSEYVPDAYWYYFQASGKALKGSNGSIKKTTVDGKKYAFNEFGQMLTGWFDETGTIYTEDNDDPFSSAVYYGGGENDGVLRSGWVTFNDGTTLSNVGSGNYGRDLSDVDNLYFYFNTTNNKKLGVDESTEDYVTKKINGKTYAFAAGNGIMLAEWDAYNYVASTSKGNTYYFSDSDDGHQAKKGWVYAVPNEAIDKSAHDDDEEKYMYFLNNGDMVMDQIKKINGKYYAFNKSGIMQTGVVMYKADGSFAAKWNSDNTRGAEVAKEGIYRNGDNEKKSIDNSYFIHYFGSDGARRTGANVIEFADDTYTFASNNNGHFEGVKSKKYYSKGILLAASADIKYGLMTYDYENNSRKAQSWDEPNGTENRFVVLTTAGAKQKGATSAKKDADGNYWFIDKDKEDQCLGIWSVEIKKTNNADATDFTFKKQNTEYAIKVASGEVYWFKSDFNGSSNKWIPFGLKDDAGKTCTLNKKGTGKVTDDELNKLTSTQDITAFKATNTTDGSYAIKPSNDYALNFTWSTATP